MIRKFKKATFVLLFAITTVLILEVLLKESFVLQVVRVTFKGDRVGQKNDFRLSDDPVLLYEWKNLPQEVYQHKPSDVSRIFVLGDSITYMKGYNIKECYPFILEQVLNASIKDGGRHEVINWGVPGYNLIQETRLLEKKVVTLSPDVVIVGYCTANDRLIKRRIIKYKDDLYCSDALESFPYVSVLPDTVSAFLMQHSFIWRFMNYKVASLIEKRASNFWKNKIKYFDISQETENAIKKIKLIALKNNFHILFVIFPVLRNGTQQECDWIIEKCNKYGINYIDLRSSFERFGYEKLKLKTSDYCHPNSQGHRLAAEEILRYLRSASLDARQ